RLLLEDPAPLCGAAAIGLVFEAKEKEFMPIQLLGLSRQYSRPFFNKTRENGGRERESRLKTTILSIAGLAFLLAAYSIPYTNLRA
ncbi:hypothetical protein HY988_06810, partial [Candidatus Micrarchaeota archaeon]|nr:hypothetical protein [Candidatus Micrarchaeota archaeon]